MQISRRDFNKAAIVLPILSHIPINDKSENLQVVYKLVLRLQDGRLCSVVSENSKYTIFYKIGEWHYPKIGRLYGFDTLENLKKYDNNTTRFKCLAKDIRPQSTMSCIYRDLDIERFWNYPCSYSKQLTPKGTISFTAVKLLEEIPK